MNLDNAKSTKINYEAVILLGLVHLAALAAIPFFTWGAFITMLIMLFGISPIGVNLTYHRLLSHRAFKTPKWFEYVLVTLGTLSAQGPVLPWVAGHRYHHRYADDPIQDIHTPLRGGFWGAHLISIVTITEFFSSEDIWIKYVPDLSKDRYYRFLTKYNLYIAWIPLILLYYFGGISYFMWGGFVRVVLMFHITWLVNSASHMWGYRNFETPDHSRNCWWVGLLAAGEGWHNNHHAQPKSAAHGMRWFEFDLTWVYIRFFELFGLIYDVKRPNYELLEQKRIQASDVQDAEMLPS